jgi:Sec-independent protein secretion pathway component TatC
LRRHIYFALAILACAITPGDVVTASILLTIPLVLLYELGIWLARSRPARQE